MSKQDRYTSWKPCMDCTYQLFRLIIRAGNREEGKFPVLEDAVVQLEQLKGFLRISHKLKAISHEKHLGLQEALQEIGTLLREWMQTLGDLPSSPELE